MAAFWNKARPEAVDIRTDAASSAQIDEYVAGIVPSDGPGLALAVAIDSAVVHAAGYGLADVAENVPVTPATIFHLASCGKQFTGLGILLLAEDGKLGLDDPIGKHIRELAGFGSELTIRRLLNHTSGIRDLYGEVEAKEVLKRSEQPTNADIVRTYVALGHPMAERGMRPGDAFSYSNSGYELLGSLIERVSGQTYHDFFQGRVFGPLGMVDTFSIPDQRTRDPRCAAGYALNDNGELIEPGSGEFEDLVGAGSFYTTVLDLCRYEQALRSNTLVSDATMQNAFTVGETNDGNPTNYGFGWYVGDDHGIPYADHEGSWNGYYSYICVYLDQQFSFFVLTNSPGLDFEELAKATVGAYSG